MGCNSCVVNELWFDIKVEGDFNLSVMTDITEYIKGKDIAFIEQDKGLRLKESDVRDFYDFCVHHMDIGSVLFRVQDQPWIPFSRVAETLETSWVDDIIKKELVTCYFQPIMTVDEEIFGYEFLSRFEKEDGTLIYPNVVFDAARTRGRLFALDRICRMNAVREAAFLKNTKKKAFINFIPTSIYSPEHCLKSTTQLANEIGIDHSQLVFEVVETEKVKDVNHLKMVLAYYRDKGFEYALDDVGEGYSTVEMLEGIVPHYMKLDMKYVQGVNGNSSKQQIATEFLQKAMSLGVTPLAEGVEEKVDFEWLKSKGYKLFQGYLFGRPNRVPQK